MSLQISITYPYPRGYFIPAYILSRDSKSIILLPLKHNVTSLYLYKTWTTPMWKGQISWCRNANLTESVFSTSRDYTFIFFVYNTGSII